MLGDCPSAWASFPRGARAPLWTALRVTFLAAVWEAYYSREPQLQTSRAVVDAVIAELRRLMRCRFAAAALTPATLTALPLNYLTAQLRPASIDDFSATWAVGGLLCTVAGGADGPPVLSVLLTASHPLMAPL